MPLHQIATGPGHTGLQIPRCQALRRDGIKSILLMTDDDGPRLAAASYARLKSSSARSCTGAGKYALGSQVISLHKLMAAASGAAS